MSVKPLRIGEFRHRVTIQQRTVARTVHGGFSLSWANLRASISAKIDPKTGREFFFSDAVRAEATHFITIRAQTETITPDMRLTFGSRVFNIIQALRVDEIKHELRIAAVENLSTSENSAGTANALPTIQTVYQTVEWDFTTTNTQTFTIPSGKRFFLDSVEVACTVLSGTVTTQPTITAGITGNLTKYLSRLTTLLSAAHKRQGYSTLLANEGETEVIVKQSVAGAVSVGGTYKGIVIIKGILVG